MKHRRHSRKKKNPLKGYRLMGNAATKKSLKQQRSHWNNHGYSVRTRKAIAHFTYPGGKIKRVDYHLVFAKKKRGK